MKLIIMGDTHGREFWKYVVNTQEFDKIVFIGDYFDSFDVNYARQMNNFLDICAYKAGQPDKAVLLVGNHDFHYTPTARIFDEKYSGFQPKHQHEIAHALQLHGDLLQMAYMHGDYLFTHAGVTRSWLLDTMNLPTDSEPIMQGIFMDEYINAVYKHSPRYFCFRGTDPYGDDITQSPIWVRPQSLMSDAVAGYHQVVGHTHVGMIAPNGVGEDGEDKFFFIDALDSRQCLVIEDGVTSVLNV